LADAGEGDSHSSKFIGCLKNRAFASLEAIRVRDDLPGVTNLIEFLEGLVDLLLNVIRLTDSAGCILRHETTSLFG